MRVWNLIKGYTVLVYIFMFAPIAVVLLLAFNSSQFGGFPIEGISLRWFYRLFENEAIVRAFKTRRNPAQCHDSRQGGRIRCGAGTSPTGDCQER